MKRSRRAAGLWAAAVLASAPAFAQTTGDALGVGRPVLSHEALDNEAQSARFRLGPVRIQPLLSLSNVGYTNHVGLGVTGGDGSTSGEVQASRGDFTATVSGGLKGIYRLGSLAFLYGRVGGVYGWFAREADRRSAGLDLEAGTVVYLRRLSVDASLGSTRSFSFVSSESELLVGSQVRFARADLEVSLLGRLGVYGTVKVQSPVFETSGFGPESAASIRGLDRSERNEGFGLGYRISRRVFIRAGVNLTQLRFRQDADLRNSEGTGYGVSVGYDRPRMYVVLSGGHTEYRFAGSQSNSGVFGELTAGYSFARRLALQVQASRRQVASIDAAANVFNEERVSAGPVLTLGVVRPIILSAIYEMGANQYPGLNSSVERRDVLRTFRGSLTFAFFRSFPLSVQAYWTQVDSNLDRFDRTIFQITTGITIGTGSILQAR